MYIEPCCIHNQLPALLKEHPLSFFQSSGDWDVAKLMTAVAYLTDGQDLLLCIPEIDIDLCRTFETWFSRGWLHDLQLITQKNQADLLKQELSSRLGFINYCCDPLVLDSLIWFKGKQKHLIIQGPMLLKEDYSLCLYTAYHGNKQEIIEMATAPLLSKLRIKHQSFK